MKLKELIEKLDRDTNVIICENKREMKLFWPKDILSGAVVITNRWNYDKPELNPADKTIVWWRPSYDRYGCVSVELE